MTVLTNLSGVLHRWLKGQGRQPGYHPLPNPPHLPQGGGHPTPHEWGLDPRELENKSSGRSISERACGLRRRRSSLTYGGSGEPAAWSMPAEVARPNPLKDGAQRKAQHPARQNSRQWWRRPRARWVLSPVHVSRPSPMPRQHRPAAGYNNQARPLAPQAPVLVGPNDRGPSRSRTAFFARRRFFPPRR